MRSAWSLLFKNKSDFRWECPSVPPMKGYVQETGNIHTPHNLQTHTHVIFVSEAQSRLCNIWKYWTTHSQIISIINRNAYKTSKSRATSGDNVCVRERTAGRVQGLLGGRPTPHLFLGAGAVRGGVTGRPELTPPYWYFAFFSEGFRICITHTHMHRHTDSEGVSSM